MNMSEFKPVSCDASDIDKDGFPEQILVQHRNCCTWYERREDQTIGAKINKLGDAFRGLWKTRRFYENPNEAEDRYECTVMFKGDFVETPDFATKAEALDAAIAIVERGKG